MRLFSCGSCGQLVYFENVACMRCGAVLGFFPEALEVAALEAVGDDTWRMAGGGESGAAYRHCAHRSNPSICNWMVCADEDSPFCIACRLNRTIPDLAVPGNMERWRRLEAEKRRLIYSLLALDLPVAAQSEDPEGLAFEFLAETQPTPGEDGRVITGHSGGVITLNVAEADPVVRERMRVDMSEPYRTILGHFRHESGHYYWERLIRHGPWLDAFRALFGDETRPYSEALRAHYENGPPPDWQQCFVSAYASSHPWEDWAETWAHYLHIVDTLDTAYQFGLRVQPRTPAGEGLSVEPAFAPYRQADFEAVIGHWLPLTFALNSLNRSMGHEPAYPFVLAPPVIEKLDLVHRIVRHSGD
jgi:hypothetical protein